MTLAELQLAPSSILLLRFDDGNLNHSHVPAPLAPEVIAQAIDLPLPPPPAVIEANHINVESTPSTGTKSVQGKAPKWLKFAQKK